jgi:deoxyadenosine/deoxycytidine kinase
MATTLECICALLANCKALGQQLPEVVISVDGNISAGKSSFLRRIELYIERHLSEFADLFDDVQYEPDWTNVNGVNYLQEYYDKPRENAYLFQTMVFAKRTEQHYTPWKSSGAKIRFVERSAAGDCIFPRTLHRQGIMSDLEWAAYQEWVRFHQQRTPRNTDLIAYFEVEPSECNKRKEKRSRKEEDNVVPQYLVDLHETHSSAFPHGLGLFKNDCGMEFPYVKMDAMKNFVDDEAIFETMFLRILKEAFYMKVRRMWRQMVAKSSTCGATGVIISPDLKNMFSRISLHCERNAPTACATAAGTCRGDSDHPKGEGVAHIDVTKDLLRFASIVMGLSNQIPSLKTVYV